MFNKTAKKREIKNTLEFSNIASRDYDGKINDIYATDVSYVRENHVYISVLIHYKGKKTVS